MPQKEHDPPSQFADASEQLPPMSSLELTGASAAETYYDDGSGFTCSSEPLLPRNSSSRQRAACPLKRFVVVLAFIALLTTSLLASIALAWKLRSSSTPTDSTDRVNKVWACASKLSGPRRKKDDSVMIMALSWFLTGAGKDIAISESNCDWNTPFGILYALIIIRESLSVHDKSWHPIRPLVDATEVCNWKRIKCDINKTVVALTLNHANITGTIPLELTDGLSSLTRLYLYCNENLVGPVPSEIGRLGTLKEVFLHKSGLSGPIPSELGQLTLLDELLLDGTRLSGTMPPEICKLRTRNLHDLRANCHDGGSIQCDHPTCCTSCRS